MPFVIPNTTTTNKDQKFSGEDVFASGFLTIANNPVIVKLLHGIRGQARPGPEIFLAPGTYPLAGTAQDPVSGFTIREATNAFHAQFFGVLYYPGEATILPGAEFTSNVNAQGLVQPAAGFQFLSEIVVDTTTRFLVDFTNIPQFFNGIYFTYKVASDVAAPPGSFLDHMVAQFNLDTANNYFNESFGTDGNAAANFSAQENGLNRSLIAATPTALSPGSPILTTGDMLLLDYNDQTVFHNFKSNFYAPWNLGVVNTGQRIAIYGGCWNPVGNPQAINSVRFKMLSGQHFAFLSVITMYGIVLGQI